MKTNTAARLKSLIAYLWLAIVVMAKAWAQSPPNDNFTNRIVLTGSSFNFSGSTAGATYEPSFEPLPDPVANPTIWWSWTAPVSSTVVIERLDPLSPKSGGLGVYAESDYTQPGWSALAAIDFRRQGPYLVFEAQAGQEYEIALGSTATNLYSFRLTATNAPVFRIVPTNTLAYVKGAALLKSFAIDTKPLTYQWQFNGIDIPNATNAMFLINAVSETNAGDYTVMVLSVTNEISTSSTAHLSVGKDPSDVHAVGILNETNFQFSVTGIAGRNYRLDSSADLADWSAAVQSTVSNTQSITFYQLPIDSPARFLRLTPFQTPKDVCHVNLAQINFALQICAEDLHKNNFDEVNVSDLLPYLIAGQMPVCPGGGFYILSDFATLPVCSLIGHY